jgi:hypothetical protein
MSFEKLIVEDGPVLVGNPDFDLRPLWGLLVGDCVKQIGKLNPNGNETSSHRIDNFKRGVFYSGCINLTPMHDDDGDTDTYAAFRVRPEEVNADRPVYLLYIVIDEPCGEKLLYRPFLERQVVYTYKPFFVVYRDGKNIEVQAK